MDDKVEHHSPKGSYHCAFHHCGLLSTAAFITLRISTTAPQRDCLSCKSDPTRDYPPWIRLSRGSIEPVSAMGRNVVLDTVEQSLRLGFHNQQRAMFWFEEILRNGVIEKLNDGLVVAGHV